MRAVVLIAAGGAVAVALAACASSSGGGPPTRSSSARPPASEQPSSAPTPVASTGGGHVQVRGLIAPAVPVTGPASTSVSTLGFVLPSTAAEYAALPPARQAALRAALAGTDCAHPPAATGGHRIVCLSDGGSRLALLTGRVIIAQDSIASAQPYAPDPASGRTQWTVLAHLTPGGRRAMASYTTAHNVGEGAVPDGPANCGQATMSCSDYIAWIVGDKAVSIPYLAAPVMGGQIQISGNFDQAAAAALAAALGH